MANLLKPRLLSSYNRIAKTTSVGKTARHNAITAALGLLFMYFIFGSTRHILGLVQEHNDLLAIPLTLLFAPLLFLIFLMLSLSTVLSGLAYFYASRDLVFIITTPISPLSFFLQRLLLSSFVSGWMALIILIPALLALAIDFSPPLSFYFQSIALLLPLFIIPACISLATITFSLSYLSYSVTRILVRATMMILLFSLVGIAVFSPTSPTATSDTYRFFEILQHLQISFSPYLPSLWSAKGLDAALNGKPVNWSYWAALYGTMATTLGFGYATHRGLFYKAFGKYQNKKAASSRSVQLRRFIRRQFMRFWNQRQAALMVNDLSLQMREPGQIMQTLLLLVIALVACAGIPEFDPRSSVLLLGSFRVLLLSALYQLISGAFCGRFLVPAVSLEGAAYWVLAKSPLGAAMVIEAKQRAWQIVGILISAVVWIIAIIYYSIPPAFWPAIAMQIALTTYNLSTLGIRASALNTRFDWEYLSQLSTGIGALLYMLQSILLSTVLFGIVSLWLLCIVFMGDSSTSGALGGQIVILLSGLVTLATSRKWGESWKATASEALKQAWNISDE